MKNNTNENNLFSQKVDRKKFLLGAGALASSMLMVNAEKKAKRKNENTSLPEAKFTLAPHLHASFPKTYSTKERVEAIAKVGSKVYQIGSPQKFDVDELKSLADDYGLRCASLAGTGTIGFSTGLTVPGKEKLYLDYFTKMVNIAKKLKAVNLVSFVGKKQKDIPWDKQYKQIISGLKKAGDIAGEAGVYLTLEPLNRVKHPKMTVLTAQEGFQIVREVNHPHVTLDFDIYHIQLSEGNITNNLREGLKDKLIQFVEVGDVPGRNQPGTGEINYKHIFNELRRLEYKGFIGMEHFPKPDFETAYAQIKELAGLQ